MLSLYKVAAALALTLMATGCQSSANKEQKEAAEAQQRADLEKSAAEQKLTRTSECQP